MSDTVLTDIGLGPVVSSAVQVTVTGATGPTRLDDALAASTVGATGATGAAGATGVTGATGISGPTTPASAAATGVAGTVVWDTGFIYVCTATNTWKRAAIATWP